MHGDGWAHAWQVERTDARSAAIAYCMSAPAKVVGRFAIARASPIAWTTTG